MRTNPGVNELNGLAGETSSSSSYVHETKGVAGVALVATLAGARASSPINVHGTSAARTAPTATSPPTGSSKGRRWARLNAECTMHNAEFRRLPTAD